MLNIRRVKHLARHLRVTEAELNDVCSNVESYYQSLFLTDPAKPDRLREVVNVKGLLRILQGRLLKDLLLLRVAPNNYSYGGVKGRHIKLNAEQHRRASHAIKADISNFYPSIHHSRVYRLFSGPFGCSPDVARICTRLCTYKGHLALGLVTSPFLADQVLAPIDARLGAVCKSLGLTYTRFVDDVTISGAFNLNRSGFEGLLRRILGDSGFKINNKKTEYGKVVNEILITGVRINQRRNFDVAKSYALEVERQLRDAESLAWGGSFQGPYYTAAQIRGRIQFVGWVNPNRRVALVRRYKRIDWDQVRKNASTRGLVISKKRLLSPSEAAAYLAARNTGQPRTQSTPATDQGGTGQVNGIE